MQWKKRGLIYCANGESDWMVMRAQSPTPLLLEDRIRVFVAFCNSNDVGRIGYVDVKRDNPSDIIRISKTPVLDIGRSGAFDDNGVVPISIMREPEAENRILLYYIGFQLGVKVPYYMFCGLAISEDEGNSFFRYSESPILDRSGSELYAKCGCNVIYDQGKYRMYYIGSYRGGWIQSGEKLRPLYMMKYTESDDGITWPQTGVDCMNFESADEHGFGRPYVWRDGEKFRMYGCIRTYSHGYYISYWESSDGINWVRMQDKCGITLSQSGWDNENMAFPYILKVDDKTYMFYNGNGAGKSGFGYAELEGEL